LRGLKNFSSLDSVRNKEGQRLGMFYVLILYNNCHSLFTCFHSDHVFVSTDTLSVHVATCFMYYPRCNTLAVRTRDVAPRPARIADITLSRNYCARRHLLSCNRHPLARKKVKESKDQEFWVHPYPTTSSRPRWRCVQSLVQIGLEM
jgi:hypothetical protein